jgi:hypothetical protein
MEHNIGKLLIEAELAERLGQAGQVQIGAFVR